VQHAVEQHHVGAGQDLQVQVGDGSAVSVRRGSTTTIFSAGFARLASSMRRNRMGCAQAALLPAMNRHCAWFRSS
jgi:hypothetical protein